MRQAVRWLIPLLLVLGLLAWGASYLLDHTSRRWFEEDVRLRAQLAARSTRHALAEPWRDGDREHVQRVLSAITRDERILSAATCGADLQLFASTGPLPREIDCAVLGDRIRSPSGDGWTWRSWTRTLQLSDGDVHISALPVEEGDAVLGFLVLVHDMSFADRRAATMRRFTFAAFIVLALLSSLVTVTVARASWRNFTREFWRMLRGPVNGRAFAPPLRDVRDLVSRIREESFLAGRDGLWTADRLRWTLQRQLQGETVTILANREPYIHDRNGDGRVRVLHPASGLVTALEPVMQACSGVWVAHGSGPADRENSDARGHLRVPPGEESYALRRVWLTPEEERGYYYGFANEGLWPLCHLAHTRPIFRIEDWGHYQTVNRRFADAVCEEVDGPDPIVLVQDYHFALAPAAIRERLPRSTLLSFWHIPWPNAEHFGICPWSREILQGLLGSSILGFQTQAHCNNFLEAVDRFLEARIDREDQAVVLRGRTTLVRPYPISIEWPSRWLRTAPPVAECRAGVRAELGLPPDALLGVGVDRLDYTKGLEERLLAVERMLEQRPDLRGRFTFVELGAPSRTLIPRYRDLNQAMDVLVERINARFPRNGCPPIVLLRGHHEPPVVFRFYRAADLCYVSSLHDGMNLVAKEFIAARDDERGVLVLSTFAGAARELAEALVVNPYDFEQASAALAAALAMPPEEQSERLRAMRALLAEFNVYRWAGRMLIDAARVRQRDRVSTRLRDGAPRVEVGAS